MRVLTLTSPRMRGPDVVAVQKALGVGADGIFGPKTAAAVLAWKRRAGYPDGEVNAGIGPRGQGYLLRTTPRPPDYLERASRRALHAHADHLIREKPPCGEGAAPNRPLRWPVKPFDGPHQVRGVFGEVRGLQEVVGTAGLTGARLGAFLAGLNPVLVNGDRNIHHGIDIVAPDLTPVYALTDGVAVWGGSSKNRSRFVRVGDFDYVHLADPIPQGRQVRAFQTVIGKVHPGSAHVHLSRYVRGKAVNPLRFGGMVNYTDTAPPLIRGLFGYRQNGTRVNLHAITGAVSLFVDAVDIQSTGGNETGIYRLGYRILNAAGQVAVGPYQCLQMDVIVPEPVGNILYTTGSTRNRFQTSWLYRLTVKSPSADGVLHTGHLAPGPYVVRVTAADVMGNSTRQDFPIAIVR
jgi:hypothetical protein